MEPTDDDNRAFTDSEKVYCKGGCKRVLTIESFGRKADGGFYKHCNDCRNNKNKKLTREQNVLVKEIKREKRENRPSISDEKKQMILKDQDNYCRGPKKYECKYYECDMRINNKRFNDQKSVIPQYDHIIRWKEGGNSIENLQALCPNCHWMKTRMESIINEDKNSLNNPRIKGSYESLTKTKYRKVEGGVEDSSSSDEDEFCVSGRRRRNIYYYSTLKSKPH